MTQADDAIERIEATLRESILSGHLEKHAMEQKAVKTALDAVRSQEEKHRDAHSDAHRSHENIHEVTTAAHREQHKSENEAVKQATTSMDRRLDQMNEFREQLRDRETTFARKDALEAFIQHYEKAHDEVLGLVATEREERRASEGVKRGMSQTTTIIVAAIGVVGTVLGIVIILSNVLTGT